MSDERLPWIPTPADVAIIRQLLEDNEATIATLRARVAELEAELASQAAEMTSRLFQIVELEDEVSRLKGREGTWAIVDGLNQRID